MTEYEFWQQIKTVGQVTYDWLYPTIALPAFILAASVFVLSVFAARRYKKVHNRFLMLFLATVPLVLTFPAVYITMELPQALSRVGITLPDAANDFPATQAIRVGQALNAFALWAVIGTTLTLPILWSGLLVTEAGPVGRAVKEVTRRVTNIATRAFGNRGGMAGPKQSPYGSLTVNRGQRKGSIEAARPEATIGGKGDIQINDPVTSRIHAKLLLIGSEIGIQDMGSTNGTFVRRAGQDYPLNGQPIALAHGDLVYLGDPNMPEAVEMLYQRQPGV
jgi:hypothetical protein